MNCINLVGRVIADPELRFLEAAGKQVATVPISVNRPFKRKGASYPDSDVFRVKVWGKRGENLHEHVSKGSIISVTGRVELRKVEGGSGHYVEVADADWGFVPKQSGDGGQGAPSYDEAESIPF